MLITWIVMLAFNSDLVLKAWNWHKHVFSCNFYLLLCHDQTPKLDRLIPIAIKTMSIRSTRNTVSAESCKICRVHCKTHGSFVTVIMNNQTRNMYIQFQKRVITITKYYILCNVYQRHEEDLHLPKVMLLIYQTHNVWKTLQMAKVCAHLCNNNIICSMISSDLKGAQFADYWLIEISVQLENHNRKGKVFSSEMLKL